MGKKELARNVLLLISVIALGLALIDISARIFFPQYNEVIQYDDTYLHKFIPNSFRIHAMEPKDGSIKQLVKINSLGFRDDEFSPQKSSTRIMVYGDSFIEAPFSKPENTFVKKLQAKLGSQLNRPVEVINAGVIAYGPDQVSLRLEHELDAYRPDAVIVALFVGNDFGEGIRNRIYRLDSEGRLVKNNYHIRPSLKTAKKLATIFPSARLYTQVYYNIHNLLAGGNANYTTDAHYFVTTVQDNTAQCEDFIIKGNNQVTNLFHDTYDIDMVINPDSYCTEYKKKLMDGIIGTMKQLADARNVKLFILVIPSKHEVDPYIFHNSVSSFNHEGYDRSYLTGLAENLSLSHGIPTLNLYPYFVEKNVNNSFYFNALARRIDFSLKKLEVA